MYCASAFSWMRRLSPRDLHLQRQLSFVTCGCANTTSVYRKNFKSQPSHLRSSQILGGRSLNHSQIISQYRCLTIGFDKIIEIRSHIMRNWFGADVAPVKFMMESLQSVHDDYGLPWWATILVTTYFFKSILTLPLAIFSRWQVQKLNLLNPLLEFENLKLSRKIGYLGMNAKMNDADKTSLYKVESLELKRNFYITHNVHPLKGFVVITTQLPLWFFLSFSMRHLSGGWEGNASTLAPDMATGGLFWFQDLLVPDPLMILPVTACVLNLLCIQHGVYMSTRNGGQMSRIETFWIYIFRILSVMFIPLGYVNPSALSLYWVISVSYALIQRIALENIFVQRFVGIPPLKKRTLKQMRNNQATSAKKKRKKNER